MTSIEDDEVDVSPDMTSIEDDEVDVLPEIAAAN